MRLNLIALGTLLCTVIQTGCEAPAPPRRSMSLVRLSGVTEQRAFLMTQAVLNEFDFRLESIDADAGHIRSFAREETIRGGTGRISDPIVRSPNRVRRIAEAYVRSAPNGVEIRLAVSRERLDTASYRAFARERREEDTPTETPIDLDTATTPEQYESWTAIGRDRELEVSIRRALEERLARGE